MWNFLLYCLHTSDSSKKEIIARKTIPAGDESQSCTCYGRC
jgi:hypothetical protein